MGAGVSSRAPSRASVVSSPGDTRSQPDIKTQQTKSPKKETKKDESESKIKKDAKKKEIRTKDSSTVGKDIMISYSHADTDFMKKFKGGLEAAGISTWVDVTGLKAGVDFLSKIGQAIIDAKMFVQLLTPASIKSKYCQDELALAYVSNKPIFPVGLSSSEELFPLMDTGMKLQLARFNWNLFCDEEKFAEDLDSLVQKLKAFKEGGTMETSLEKDNPSYERSNSRKNVNRHLQKKNSFGAKMETMMETVSDDSKDFWSKHFQNKTSVSWDMFSGTFKKEYSKPLSVVFSAEDREWLERVVHRELIADDDENDDVIKHEMYIDFITVDGEQKSFWERVQDQAVESYTMKEVFDMSSTVRVEAIENLGKFRSKAVVEALLDLLHDKDNNIRAVAAISLARTGEDSPNIIKQLTKCLNDSDRLVREGACLALGHLKAYQAVTKILHLWRNDFISSVREAAQVALEQIGGTEANKAMYITKVLSEEIRQLTQD